MLTQLNEEQKMIYFMYLLGIGLESIDARDLQKIEEFLFKHKEYYEDIKKEFQIIQRLFEVKIKTLAEENLSFEKMDSYDREEVTIMFDYWKNSPPHSSNKEKDYIIIKCPLGYEEDDDCLIVKIPKKRVEKKFTA